MKKIISIIISLAFILIMATTVVAVDDIYTVELSSGIEMDVYANEIIHAYIDMNVPNISEVDSFFITPGFVTDENLSATSKIYFLFLNDNCVGELTVSIVNDEYCSSFVFADIPIITSAYKNNSEIIFVKSDKSVYILSNNSIFCIYGLLAGEFVDCSVLNDIEFTSPNYNIFLNDIGYVRNRASIMAGNGNRLDVDIVENYTPTEEGTPAGTCWLSVVSSIASFRTNVANAYDTSQVYYGLYNVYAQSEYPHGSVTWIKRAYSYLALLNVQHYSNSMLYSAVKAKIDAGIPIHADITTSSGNTSHSVAICGYQSASGAGYFYILMDPNKSSYVTVSLTSSSATTFTYATTYGYTFTNWYRSFY